MTPLQPGDRMDHFRLEELAARSGMASIFRATDTRTGETVAIKIPHSEMECDPVFFDRFQREEIIGRKLDHPGVMKVLANPDRSRVYMVMEWVEGRPLRELLTEPVPQERAIGFALSICDALDHIHSAGVVHRDLKPENVMVDGSDRIKLIDFGVAGARGLARLTFGKLSHLMGTPTYISPEQVRGRRGDARSDIYALGSILYEMLTGRAPFQGPNPLVVMNQRLRDDPVPPRRIDPRISPQVEQIVLRALERDPRHRYSTIGELARDLEHPEEMAAASRVAGGADRTGKQTASKRAALYALLALIPITILCALLLVARQA